MRLNRWFARGLLVGSLSAMGALVPACGSDGGGSAVAGDTANGGGGDTVGADGSSDGGNPGGSDTTADAGPTGPDSGNPGGDDTSNPGGTDTGGGTTDGGGTGGDATGGGDAGGGGDTGGGGTDTETQDAGGQPSSFDDALPVDLDPTEATPGLLADAESAKDYYMFSGTAGDRVAIIANAQSLVEGSEGDDPTILDTVVTLYDADKMPIAQNDDAFPRLGTDSQLYTVLPADGDYYFTVEGCASAFGDANCADPAGVTTLDYEVFVVHTEALIQPEVNAGTGQDGTVAKAVAIPYATPSGGSAGYYGFYLIDGSLTSASDTHVFTFTPPADVSVDPAQRAHAEFWVQPIGADNGNGSTAHVKVWVADAAGTTVLSQADQANYGGATDFTNGPLTLTVPVDPGQSYSLFVQSAEAGSSPTTDFYFLRHFVGSFYYGTLEAETKDGTMGSNDALATAEALSTPSGATEGAYFVDGDLDGPADTDWYKLGVPGGATKASVFCDAQRAGSGLRGFTVGLFDLDGNPVAGSSGTEGADADLGMTGITVPGGASDLYLKATATSQDPMVTGAFYHCSISFQ